MKNVLKLLLGSANDRIVKSYEKTVSVINKLEPKYTAMSDDEIHGLTALFRERLKNGEKEKDILPDVFAAVREAAKRSIGLRHFDVQLIGGMVLNNANGHTQKSVNLPHPSSIARCQIIINSN